MKTPVQITYRHMTPSEALTKQINEEVAKLEEFAEHIVECRVIVDEPNQHHREKHFRVEVVVLLSGAELVAGRDPTALHQEDAYQVVHDSFRAIHRQLHDHLERRRSELKHPTAPVPL